MFVKMEDFIVEDAMQAALSYAEQQVERIKKSCWAMYKAPYLLGTRDMREADRQDRKRLFFHLFEIIFPDNVVSTLGPDNFRRSLLVG